jgi:hypothetical protein
VEVAPVIRALGSDLSCETTGKEGGRGRVGIVSRLYDCALSEKVMLSKPPITRNVVTIQKRLFFEFISKRGN